MFASPAVSTQCNSTQCNSTQGNSTRVANRADVRTVFVASIALGLIFAPFDGAGAQELPASAAPSEKAWTFRMTSGALVLTGAQRSVLKDAQLSAAGASLRVQESLSLTGTFSWARSRVQNTNERPKVDVFNVDLGVELRGRERAKAGAVTFRPFAGAGAGVRSYNYRAPGVDATNHPAGYLAVGGEVGLGRVGVRLEARDYASRFAAPVSSAPSSTRNDVVISAGLQLKKRRAPQS